MQTHIHILQLQPPPRSSIFPFYTCFLSLPPTPNNLLRKSTVPRPRSLTSFGHFSGANSFIQEKTNHVPVGASPASPSTYWTPAPPGTPHIHTHKPRSWGRGLGANSECSYTSLKHSPLRYSPSPFWFPADCWCILGAQSHSSAEWQLSRASWRRGLRSERGRTPRFTSPTEAEQRRTL